MVKTLEGSKMDTIKNFLIKVKSFIFDMKPEQKMKLGASGLLLFGATALALAAANDDDEVIDISETAEIIDEHDTIDAEKIDSSDTKSNE